MERKFSRFKTVIAALIMLSAFNIEVSGAGGKLTGKVVDIATGDPLLGVNVVIIGMNQGAATDNDGDYVILNIPPGTYDVKASMIGYKSVTKTGVIINIDHTTTINFSLEQTALQIDENIIVTAERPLIEKDMTSTRHFVSADEISVRPTSQLTEILTTLPGIDVDRNGQLAVRRGSLDQVSFVIDGIRARNPLDFQPYTSVNVSAIQELEIITGGFNAEYGEAQSGVFNVVTKEGNEKFEGYGEFRYTPPGLKHWGTALYDYSNPKYWENTHARHLQWWIDNPQYWVDPNGIKGNDPASIWTPEQAYQNYMSTHQPLTDYTDESSYQTEISLGGPAPVTNMFFFFSGKYRTAPPITGNSFLSRGSWFDGDLKLTYRLSNSIKFMISAIYSYSKTSYGMEDFTFDNGFDNKYALYDFAGYPRNRLDGEILKMTHVLDQNTFYELTFSRYYRLKSQSTFPGDEAGWETGAPLYDNLRALDSVGIPIPGGYNNIIGLHTTGYYYRGEDKNTDYTFSGDFVSQIRKEWQLKAGFDFTYYLIDRFQQGKAYNIFEKSLYKPYEGDIYVQCKLEFEGLIMNPGLRLDFYNPNNYVYTNLFDPLGIIAAQKSNTAPVPQEEKTKTYGQLSPRIGISHPISENTVLHFSYGHFFQRAPFGDYGEGTGSDAEGQSVRGILNTYLQLTADSTLLPYNLGNRNLKPRKTVEYELGIEHNLSGMVFTITGFYKDYTNLIRTIRIFMDDGTQYLTTGNSNYGDAKGVEISLRRPLIGYWGGYLNYTWSTGITGRSGDPDVVASPLSGIQSRVTDYTGDYIDYDPARLKFGLILSLPKNFTFLNTILSNLQVSFDYQVYYPHKKVLNDIINEGGKTFIRYAFKNANIRIRKDFDLFGTNLGIFMEMQNAFNDRWSSFEEINSANMSPQARANFVNSGFSVFPDYTPTGDPFPDVLRYYNLPRSVVFGVAVGL